MTLRYQIYVNEFGMQHFEIHTYHRRFVSKIKSPIIIKVAHKAREIRPEILELDAAKNASDGTTTNMRLIAYERTILGGTYEPTITILSTLLTLNAPAS
jgi:hypothetical protein